MLHKNKLTSHQTLGRCLIERNTDNSKNNKLLTAFKFGSNLHELAEGESALWDYRRL